MIPIYLCEDNQEELYFLKKKIENYIFIEGMDFMVVCAANSPRQLLDALPRRGQSAVYFLDVDLRQSMNGIELAAKIREMDPRAYIIFTTTHEEMALSTFQYKVEALDYLIKDDPEYIEKIQLCLNHILQKSYRPSEDESSRLHFHLPDRELFLLPEDIYFIRTDSPHWIAIHTACGIYQCSAALKDVLDMWSGFFQCHKSILVNPRHIRFLDKNSHEIALDNGATCPCSYRLYQKLQRLLDNSP